MPKRTRSAPIPEWLAATVFARGNLRRYLRNLTAQHREFTFLGRTRPLELENIYVSLKVGEYTPRALRPDGPTGPSEDDPHAPIVAGRLVEIPEALSLSRRLAVLGDPGSGKTTLLKYLVLQMAQRDTRLETFARALVPTLSNRLLELVCRFLSGLNALSLKEIAKEEDVVGSYVTRLLRLSFLAPDIVAAILKGEQPAELTASRLAQWKNLPLDWTEQRKVLGFT